MGARAGFWIRVVAAFIDGVALIALAFACGVVYSAAWYRTYDEATSMTVTTIALCVAWLLYTSTEIWFAATPGKLAVGLRITRIDGAPADRWRRFLRWETKYYPWICSLLFAATGLGVFYALGGFMNLILLVSCLFALNDDQLTWHDEWAGTSVSWKRRGVAPVTAPPPPLPAV